MHAPRSVRTYLVGLIFGVLLPLLGFCAFLVMRSAEREQDAIAAAARNRTRIAATVISDEIGALRGRLFLLASGLSPQSSDLSEFHARAKAAFGGMTVILSSASGQEMVNTNVPVWHAASRNFQTRTPYASSPNNSSRMLPTCRATRSPIGRSS